MKNHPKKQNLTLQNKRDRIATKLLEAEELQEERYRKLHELGIDLSEYETLGAEVTAIVALLYARTWVDFVIIEEVVSAYLYRDVRHFEKEDGTKTPVKSPEELVEIINQYLIS